MDLQGMESIVLTLGNGQIWLGTSPVVLEKRHTAPKHPLCGFSNLLVTDSI